MKSFLFISFSAQGVVQSERIFFDCIDRNKIIEQFLGFKDQFLINIMGINNGIATMTTTTSTSPQPPAAVNDPAPNTESPSTPTPAAGTNENAPNESDDNASDTNTDSVARINTNSKADADTDDIIGAEPKSQVLI